MVRHFGWLMVLVNLRAEAHTTLTMKCFTGVHHAVIELGIGRCSASQDPRRTMPFKAGFSKGLTRSISPPKNLFLPFLYNFNHVYIFVALRMGLKHGGRRDQLNFSFFERKTFSVVNVLLFHAIPLKTTKLLLRHIAIFPVHQITILPTNYFENFLIKNKFSCSGEKLSDACWCVHSRRYSNWIKEKQNIKAWKWKHSSFWERKQPPPLLSLMQSPKPLRTIWSAQV